MTKKTQENEYNNTGETMKKMIIMTCIVLIIPLLITKIIKKEKTQEKKYKLEKNIEVRLKRESKNKIEKIPIEKYLIGVLAGEMPVSYDIEALKAQAVAARTYTINKIEQNKEKDYDLVDTTNDQVYKDEAELKEVWKEKYEQNVKKIKQALKQTKGEYMIYEGKPIHAFFFSTSSGATENCKDVFGENLPYLVSVSSIWDENSPSYNGELTLTKTEFCEKLQVNCDNLNINIERNATNSIKQISINDKIIKGTDLRFKLGLKSTNLEIEQKENDIIIKSKGYGHGVGMSQYGAKELANNGYKYDEILKYYYRGIEIKKI